MVFISTQNLMGASRASTMQAQSDLAKVQQELSSGKKADVGLSLGADSSHVIALNLQASQLQSYTDSNTLADTRLTSTSSAVSTLQTTATSFLSTLSTANPNSAANSALISSSQSNLSAMTSILNTAVNGEYIFGGINTTQQPMTTYTASPPSANKQAVDDSFQAAFGFSQTSSSASSVTADQMQSYLDTNFAALFSPAGYSGTWSAASDEVASSQISANQTADTSVSANETAFRTLAQAYTMVSEFSGQTLNPAATQVVTNTAMGLISKAMNGLTAINADVGVSQSAISDANDRISSQVNLLTTQSNTLQGVDATALSVKVSALQTQIQASYEITAKLQNLSLVSYIA